MQMAKPMYKLIWSTSASTGDELAAPVDATTPDNSLACSNVVIGTTMTGAESVADSYAGRAPRAWLCIEAFSV